MTNYGIIQAKDIINRDIYLKNRKELRQNMVDTKKNRRLDIGPNVTIYFENKKTIMHQINEMVFIENGGDAQIKEEIEAYKSLVPTGNDLISTLMVEIDNPIKRAEILSKLGGFEEKLYLKIGDTIIKGEAELDGDRTTADGKASSVQFVHFNFNETEKKIFKTDNSKIEIGISHEYYQHSTVMNNLTIRELREDLS
jgi:hypothetical protein